MIGTNLLNVFLVLGVTAFLQPIRLGERMHLVDLVGLVVITLLSAMDATIVATALPSIVADIGGERQMGWVFASYTLAMTVSMPVFGRLGDLRGRRALYLGSIAAFVLASVLCGFAADLEAKFGRAASIGLAL